jgi:hypothetical protein
MKIRKDGQFRPRLLADWANLDAYLISALNPGAPTANLGTQ